MTRVQAAYEVARLVYAGSLAPGVGAKQLHEQHGLNINSARDFIMVYRQLMRGELFKRSLSAPDMNYFLSCIARDSGPVALRTAVHALWLHLRYYEGIRNVTMRRLRGIAASHQANAAAPEAVEELTAAFGKAVRRSLSSSSAQRAKRLKAAPKIPARMAVVLLAFIRNADVVAEVLLRANGSCESCKQSAPFLRRKDNTPYLEVHHLQQLADGGEDTVENAIALCPNCHRKLHYGAPEA